MESPHKNLTHSLLQTTRSWLDLYINLGDLTLSSWNRHLHESKSILEDRHRHRSELGVSLYTSSFQYRRRRGEGSDRVHISAEIPFSFESGSGDKGSDFGFQKIP